MSRSIVVLFIPLVNQWHPTAVRVGARPTRLNNSTYHLRTTESVRGLPGAEGRECQRRHALLRSSSCRAIGRREGPYCGEARHETCPTKRLLQPPKTERGLTAHLLCLGQQVFHVYYQRQNIKCTYPMENLQNTWQMHLTYLHLLLLEINPNICFISFNLHNFT